MNAFLTAFAAETGLSDTEAEEQWAGYSRQLSDAARQRIEERGSRAGQRIGREFLRTYPETTEQNP